MPVKYIPHLNVAKNCLEYWSIQHSSTLHSNTQTHINPCL